MKEGKIKAGVCFFCHDGRGNYLISKRAKHLANEPGTWSPGSGTIEFGEHVEDTLLRELNEEYNVTNIKESKFMGFRDWISETTGIHWFVFDYLVEVDPTEAINNEPD